VLLRTTVVGLDGEAVLSKGPDGETTHVPTRTIVWAAGVVASELAAALAAASGAALDRGGRVAVGPDLAIRGHPEVIALGDMASVHDAQGNAVALPGLASTAMQQGRHAAKTVQRRAQGKPSQPFRFVDKGNLATIGRAHAVAEIKGIQVSGLADLGERPHLLSDRVAEQAARPHPLGVQLRDTRSRRAADHRERRRGCKRREGRKQGTRPDVVATGDTVASGAPTPRQPGP
jgi:hypothetical protein